MQRLLERFSAEYLARRLTLQVEHVSQNLFGAGRGGLHFENLDFLFPPLRVALKACGLFGLAQRNTREPRVTETTFYLRDLPPAFSGLRVLHLSDLHIDGDQGRDGSRDLGTLYHQHIAPLRFDLCVITGDFRFKVHGSYERVRSEMAILAPALRCELGVFGILGNHDFVEEVPDLEALGVRMLVNEACALRRGADVLWLVGVDDAHFYGTHDLDAALHAVPDESFRILLVHSPELVEEAVLANARLYLCGHTHGGQLCLPGGKPLMVNARCPKERVVGRWHHESLHGYTSAGLGSSGLTVRLNCAPEIALHTLVRS